ncbi:Tho complex subunit 7-domain-containing protein [Xylariales sp. AK1849]|nr:Tho complex subunit 7-domain-containing protein [Xylariales sp. AK1849]
MAANNYGLLNEKEEYELHDPRLLNVENKPFSRVTKRLVAPGAFTNPNIFKLPTPPPDNGTDATATESQDASSATTTADPTSFKEDILQDFAAFDSFLVRLQFLATQNAAERERYAADRLRILDTMESVRNSNEALKMQLDEARATLAQRRKFDELADKITGNRMLRARSEQEVNIAKLTEECEELQRESETYGGTWRERKEQFDKLVEEGMNLRKLIRDEKEEVERREGMDEDGEEEGAANEDTPGAKGSQSGNATPARRSEGAATPLRDGNSSGRTPRPDSPGAHEGAIGDSLKPRPDMSGSFSRGGSQAPSLRAGSPTARSPNGSHAPRNDEPEEGEDVEMGESAQAVDTPMVEGTVEEPPQITVDAPAGNADTMDTT